MSILMASSNNDSIATRATLLSRLKDCDDQASWQEFYDTYRDLIYRFARKAGLTETEADEVVQETVIGVARKLPDFKYDPAKCAFKSWLLNQTVWRVRSQLRKRLPGAQPPTGPEPDNNGTDTVEGIADPAMEKWQAAWELDWRKTVVTAALQRVKAHANLKDCQIFELYVVRDLSPLEVARALDVNVGRVYLAKHRISRLIKAELKRLDQSLI